MMLEVSSVPTLHSPALDSLTRTIFSALCLFTDQRTSSPMYFYASIHGR